MCCSIQDVVNRPLNILIGEHVEWNLHIWQVGACFQKFVGIFTFKDIQTCWLKITWLPYSDLSGLQHTTSMGLDSLTLGAVFSHGVLQGGPCGSVTQTVLPCALQGGPDLPVVNGVITPLIGVSYNPQFCNLFSAIYFRVTYTIHRAGSGARLLGPIEMVVSWCGLNEPLKTHGLAVRLHIMICVSGTFCLWKFDTVWDNSGLNIILNEDVHSIVIVFTYQRPLKTSWKNYLCLFKVLF